MDAEKPAYLSNILGTITAPNLHHFAVHDDSLTWKKGSLIKFSSPVVFLRQDEAPKFPTMCKLTMKNMLQSVYGPGKNLRSISTALPHVTEVVLDQDVREIADSLVMESYDQSATTMAVPAAAHNRNVIHDNILLPPAALRVAASPAREWAVAACGGHPLRAPTSWGEGGCKGFDWLLGKV
ncbi:hypothetical protein C8R48DRAFT_669175 [Suillus tomentosus]|nr:hypothetical protein C8R48DRAFT_669175 [Suillus tomentosus]